MDTETGPVPTPAELIRLIRRVYESGVLPTEAERAELKAALDALIVESHGGEIDGVDTEASILAPFAE